MKKILLTLFAVAAVVIACDKDALDQDVNNINVLEQAEEIGASVDLTGAIDSSFEFIGSVEAPKGSSNSTSKVGANGTQWLHIIFFDHGGVNLAYLRSDDTDEICWNNVPGFVHSSLYTWDTTTDTLTVVVEDASGESAPVPRQQSDARATRFDRLFGATTDRFRLTNSRRSGALNGDLPTDLNTVDFGCLPQLEGSAYNITPAPFPLTGFLAKIDASFDFVGAGLDADALNYAGSSREDVIRAIENDIIND